MRSATKLLLNALGFIIFLVASSSAARADQVVITFVDPTRTLVAGSAGSFSASLTNATSSPVTVLGSLFELTITGNAPDNLFRLEYADAYLNLVSPLRGGPLILAPGESTGVIPIFTFTLNPSFVGPNPVTINGVFIVSHGDVFIPANQLGRGGWAITVLPNPDPQPEPVPEPVTALLLGTGLAGVTAKAYRNRRRRTRAG